MNTTDNRLEHSIKKVCRWSRGVIEGFDRYYTYADRNDIARYSYGKCEFLTALDMLHAKGIADIGKGLLAASENQFQKGKEHLAVGIHRIACSNALDLVHTRLQNRLSTIHINAHANSILSLLALGFPEPARHYATHLNICLANNYRQYIPPSQTYFSVEYRYSAMMLSLVNDWMDVPLPDCPISDMGRDILWGTLLACWRSETVEDVQSVLLASCDEHIARISLSEKEYKTGKHEFDFLYSCKFFPYSTFIASKNPTYHYIL